MYRYDMSVDQWSVQSSVVPDNADYGCVTSDGVDQIFVLGISLRLSPSLCSVFIVLYCQEEEIQKNHSVFTRFQQTYGHQEMICLTHGPVLDVGTRTDKYGHWVLVNITIRKYTGMFHM